jgi:hypothetical protein
MQRPLPLAPLAKAASKTPTTSSPSAGASVALTAQCDPLLWHRRFGHLNVESLQAQHTQGFPTSPALASSINNVSCDSCSLHKATVAPRNTTPYTKPSRPMLNLCSNIWGNVNFPSPHGLRYFLLVIDHYTHYMWVRFLKSKEETCTELESIMLELRHLHARHHSQSGAFARVIKFELCF